MEASGVLVKTWAQRGTLHLLAPDELPLWIGAQAALKPRYEQKSWLKPSSSRPRTSRRSSTASRRRWRTARSRARSWPRGSTGPRPRLRRPAQAGRVPRRADLRRAANVASRCPEPFEPLDAGRPTREVARRYLTRYGPATREDLAKWFGHPSPAQAGRWIEALGDEVVETEFGLGAERRRRGHRGGGAGRRRPAAAAFDQYVVAAPRDTRATRAPSASTARAAGSRRSCSSTA